MEFETPEWLTKEYLQKALEYGKEYKVLIENLKIDKPIAKGNNYVCDIFGAVIDYRKSNNSNLLKKSFIIKSPMKSQMYEMILKIGMLQKETRIYNELSPKLRRMFCEVDQENAEINDSEDDDHILPGSYFSTEENVLILDDLKVKGYKMADRLERLDYDHCVLALKALAKLHAGSVILYEKESKFIEEIGEETNVREENKEINKGFVLSVFRSFAEEIKKHPETAKYSNWFEESSDDYLIQLWEKCYKRNDAEFNVLNHGDFWAANMLFKYNDDKKPIQAKLVDLQLSRIDTPAYDFIYFMEGSAREEVRIERLNDLIDVYVNELNSLLEQKNCAKRLEKCDFERNLKDRSFFRLFISVTNLPFCIADPKSIEMFDQSTTSIDDFTKVETNPVKRYYKSKKYIEIISKRLVEYEKMGLINCK